MSKLVFSFLQLNFKLLHYLQITSFTLFRLNLMSAYIIDFRLLKFCFITLVRQLSTLMKIYINSL